MNFSSYYSLRRYMYFFKDLAAMADSQKQVIETNTLLVEELGFTIKASFLTQEKTETYNIYHLGSISELK